MSDSVTLSIKSSKKRKDFLSVKIRNHLLLETISGNIYNQYKGINLEASMMPVLVMDVFERAHTHPNLTNEERDLVTKATVLKIIPILKHNTELNAENLKLANIDIESEKVDPETVALVNNLIECYSQLKSKGIVETKGCFKILWRFLKKVLI